MQIEEICLTTAGYRAEIVPALLLNSKSSLGNGSAWAARELGEAGESVDIPVLHQSSSSEVFRRLSTARRQSLQAFSPHRPGASFSIVTDGMFMRRQVFGSAAGTLVAEPHGLRG